MFTSPVSLFFSFARRYHKAKERKNRKIRKSLSHNNKLSLVDVEVEQPLWTSVLFNLCWHEDSAFVGFVRSAKIYQLYKIFATRRVCPLVKHRRFTVSSIFSRPKRKMKTFDVR